MIEKRWEYFARVDHVHDGDTVSFDIDQGLNNRRVEALRFKGVFAPELKEPGGPEARAWVEGWVAKHQRHRNAPTWLFYIVTEKDRRSFERYVGTIQCRVCGANLNAEVNDYLAGVSNA